MILSRAYEIGGQPQWLYLHLTDPAKKTLFFLHGGPGWSDAPLAHRICHGLWDEFNTVHWDQLGANRSELADLPGAGLTLDRLVRDTLEITRLIAREFGLVRPILTGHSWGSLLCVLAAYREPALFSGFLGIGQLVSNAQSEPLSLRLARELARAAGREELLRELEAMSDNFYRNIPTLYRQREIASELGGEFKSPVGEMGFLAMLENAPAEYRSDLETLYRTCESSMELLWPEMIRIDLFKRAPELSLPVLLALGRADLYTPSAVAERWFSCLRAPSKKLEWFEESAHWPQLEEPEKFEKTLKGWISSLR